MAKSKKGVCSWKKRHGAGACLAISNQVWKGGKNGFTLPDKNLIKTRKIHSKGERPKKNIKLSTKQSRKNKQKTTLIKLSGSIILNWKQS